MTWQPLPPATDALLPKASGLAAQYAIISLERAGAVLCHVLLIFPVFTRIISPLGCEVTPGKHVDVFLFATSSLRVHFHFLKPFSSPSLLSSHHPSVATARPASPLNGSWGSASGTTTSKLITQPVRWCVFVCVSRSSNPKALKRGICGLVVNLRC